MFFLSALFSVVAPFPLIVLQLVRGRGWAAAALFTNALLVYLLAGPMSLGMYVVWIASIAWVMPELLRRGLKIEWVVSVCLGVMAVLGTVLVYIACAAKLGGIVGALLHPATVLAEIKGQLSSWIDQVAALIRQAAVSNGGLGSQADVERGLTEWKSSLLAEFPSAIAVFSLVIAWLNLVLVLRLNPARVRERVGVPAGGLRQWKSPEWLVWPTLLFGAGALFAPGPWQLVSLNALRFVLAIYVLQGLGIVAFVMDRAKVRPWVRLLIYLSSVLFGIPLVLGIGFFDLWFDFRSRLRQR